MPARAGLWEGRSKPVPADRLFKELCSPAVMKVGWHLAQADSRDDFVTDPLGHADFAANLTDRLTHLVEQIQNNRYRPRHLLTVDVPKSGLSVRPGNVLPIEEAALLHAIIYLLAPLLDNKLDKAVYSYRLHPNWKKKVKKRESIFREGDVEIPFLKRRTVRSISPFEAWYERWPEFERDAAQACTKEGYTHLTKTDITAYFENIDLRLLETEIRSLLKREENKLILLLFRLLEGWTRDTSTGTPVGRGIPQGNEVSSFLGNVYLIPLDRELKRFCSEREAKWFRYVDDVKVFTKSEHDAREAVFVINEALRSLHLNLQGSKTQILSGKSLEDELDNSELDRVEAAFKSVQKLDPKRRDNAKGITKELSSLSPLASRFTSKLPESVTNLSGKDNRLYRRLMTVYGWCRRVRFRKSALTAMKELPDLRILSKTLTYLAQLEYKTHDESLDQVLSMLEGGELPFPYQAGIVLDAAAKMHPTIPNPVASRIRSYAFGRNLRRKCHWLVAQKAVEAVLTFPYRDKFANGVADCLLRHDHPMVRRAACALLMRSPKDVVRKRLGELAHHADHGLGRLALYFQRFIQDDEFARAELGRMRKSEYSDYVFLRQLPQLYALAATQSRPVAESLSAFLSALPATRSTKVRWQRRELLSLTDWAKLPASTPPGAQEGTD